MKTLKETNHDYQGCLCGNYYDSKCTGEFSSWEDFKNNWAGFRGEEYDDTYHFVFRYDIHKEEDDNYTLELCVMLQRKGIYVHLYINNINQKELDSEIKKWLKSRSKYMTDLWKEVL